MKIYFEEYHKDISALDCVPKPSKHFLPTWYKEMPLFTNKGNNIKNCPFTSGPTTNTTLKNCVPFLDALTTGYTFTLPVDVQFTLTENRLLEWNTRVTSHKNSIGNIITLHNIDQYKGIKNLNSCTLEALIFKWQPGYSIKTPNGYSVLYTHPLNRYDLPFTTYSGVVDTDLYDGEVQFPFQINYNFKEPGDVLIIEKDTPICQILPFKRECWDSSLKKYDYDNITKYRLKYFSKIVNAYKSRYWNKKTYN